MYVILTHPQGRNHYHGTPEEVRVQLDNFIADHHTLEVLSVRDELDGRLDSSAPVEELVKWLNIRGGSYGILAEVHD